MRVVQKIIKIFALFLAGAIIVGVITGILSLVGLLGFVSGEDFALTPVSTIWQPESDQVGVQKLEVSTGAARLRIIESDDVKQIRVDSNNDNIMSWQDNDTLQVIEKGHFTFFGMGNVSDLTIYLPKNYKFTEVKIETGAGSVEIDRLVTEKVRFELGAGKTEIRYLEVTQSADIEGGAGYTILKSGKLKDLDLDLGAGKTEITAELIGNSSISSGVGRLELNAVETSGGYRFKVDKGIGSVTINGDTQSDDATYGQGENFVKLEAGVGSVEVKTVK